MATFEDIAVSAALNILTVFIILIAFAILRIQPFNDRVYFSKWYLKWLRISPTHGGEFVQKFVDFDFRSFIRFLNWMPDALKMPEPELIEHAGLDSAVYLRIYLVGLKIFVPIALVAWAVLVPVNFTNSTLDIAAKLSNVTSSDIDKLSISNIPLKSQRFWAHIVMAYAFTFWTCYVLMKEYEKVAAMRLQFLSSEKRQPDQFTVLVRNVPPDPDESVSELVEHFFLVNHPDHYLTHQAVINANKLAKLVQNWLNYYQIKYERNPSKRPVMKTGFLGLGVKVDAIGHHISEIEKLSTEEAMTKDTLEHAMEPNLKLKDYLQNAYIHPVFKTGDGDGDGDRDENDMLSGSRESENVLVPSERQSRRNTPLPSEISGASSPSPSLPNTVGESSEL